jgi:cold shock protein
MYTSPAIHWGFEQGAVEMATGTVRWFNATKGYGFIKPAQGGDKDVFVHISAVEKAGLRGLTEGQQVQYEVAVDRGVQAANLKVEIGGGAEPSLDIKLQY